MSRYASSKTTAAWENLTERPPTSGSGSGGGGSSGGPSGDEQWQTPPVTAKTAFSRPAVPTARQPPPQEQESEQLKTTREPLPLQHAQDDAGPGAADWSDAPPPGAVPHVNVTPGS